ncbi:hypothetical protein QBC32DRAFT_26242 [Pseudoneurospora amorphoporcata]|uniref:Uncharacterized protein n=1 Tax=Pseudoneurospora amorphoporcata TaxID=241081 RepID=A0AAN6SD62_9PEZI|nr:hypothetical protein QBC32DRAFT_26242 [Pseudoneurospora amorphoporcata]
MLQLECRMTAQAPPTTTLPSSAAAAAAAAATATTWNPTQTHTIAEYFVKYSMETIPESLNGELPPLPKSGPSHGLSRGHTYNNNNNNPHHGQNLHVLKRSNTYTVSTSSTSQNKHQQRYAGAESQSQQQQQQQPPSSLNRSFSSPLSPLSNSSGLGSRMVGGDKSTQRVREWMKRSNSSRTESKPKAGRSSSNSGHQTLEIIHLGGGRLESNGHVHSSSLEVSSNFLGPTSQQSQTHTSRANSIDSRVTQWSDLYHDPPESLTVATKPATATGKPSRPASPELHERPLLRDLGSGGGSGHGEGYQSQHRHTKSDGSVHPAPLRVPSNSSSSSSLDKKDGGAAVTKPEEIGKPQGQGLTRSNSKWKPLPAPPPPGAPGGITPLVDGGSRRRTDEDNINMTGAIGVSPLTSVESESEFGEREDTPRQQQGYAVQQSESKARKPSPHTDASLGIGYAVGLGVLSPPLTPPEREHYEREAVEPGSATTTCTYGIRETMWPVPPSSQQPAGYHLRSATAPPEKQQRQHQYEHQHQHHQQKPSTSSSLASASTLASSQSSVPTHVIPKRSDSLSYSRSRQHRPQISTSTSSSSSSSCSRSTGKTSPSGFRDQDQQATTATRAEAITITSTEAAAAAVAQIQEVPQPHQLQTPTVTPPTPIVQVPTPTTLTTATVPIPTPTTPTSWSPRAYLSSQEMLWLHGNYRGITAFMAAWGLQKGLSDEWEREEALGIMRELMAAEVAREDIEAKIRRGPDHEVAADEHDGGKKSWLDFEAASPGEDKRNTKGDHYVKETSSEKEKEKRGRGVNALGFGYAALKGQGVRMKPA